ncbi:hypothetical protein E2C01_097873 [Portunus trituberculatus]|uniref:Uncharacterized protein n=1 Tax=Portunus trituberculatus TaxID=210409 RepID=A0A5B7K6R0_PORTR|nr:hypothetical protein [Portunus trituberculatus]
MSVSNNTGICLAGLEHAGVPIMSPVCVVTGASVLTQRGWRNMANTSTFEPPFRPAMPHEVAHIGTTYTQLTLDHHAMSGH